VNAFLEKALKAQPTMTDKEVVEVALNCFCTVMAQEYKPSEVEVAIVTKENPVFRILTEKEIDSHMVALSDKD